ncbi:MAG: diaminopimelate epimerase [Saprospiraceae bacterium]|nr:diaminopimelate epimerase [Saprospiraceae bacterium]
MKIQFWKYQGAGNDFVMLDQRHTQTLDRSHTRHIAFLCNRHFGIGADGLILLQQHPECDFEMVYFNADGRESTMCGNGGRCIAAFAKHLGLPGEQYRFWAIDGLHEATLPHPIGPGGEWVELKMTDVAAVESNEAGQPEFVLNTGSPHFIRFAPSVDELDMVAEGRAVRYSDRFQAAGINVNLVQEGPEGHLRIRTYERGVEDETLACGTGVTAAALAEHTRKHWSPGAHSVQVHTRGGQLSVRWMAHADGSFSNIWLCGPAQRVFSGEIILPDSETDLP